MPLTRSSSGLPCLCTRCGVPERTLCSLPSWVFRGGFGCSLLLEMLEDSHKERFHKWGEHPDCRHAVSYHPQRTIRTSYPPRGGRLQSPCASCPACAACTACWNCLWRSSISRFKSSSACWLRESRLLIASNCISKSIPLSTFLAGPFPVCPGFAYVFAPIRVSPASSCSVVISPSKNPGAIASS